MECFCGDSYGKHGMVDQSKCDTNCPSNSTAAKCGGYNTIDIYKTGYGCKFIYYLHVYYRPDHLSILFIHENIY